MKLNQIGQNAQCKSYPHRSLIIQLLSVGWTLDISPENDVLNSSKLSLPKCQQKLKAAGLVYANIVDSAGWNEILIILIYFQVYFIVMVMETLCSADNRLERLQKCVRICVDQLWLLQIGSLFYDLSLHLPGGQFCNCWLCTQWLQSTESNLITVILFIKTYAMEYIVGQVLKSTLLILNLNTSTGFIYNRYTILQNLEIGNCPFILISRKLLDLDNPLLLINFWKAFSPKSKGD